MLASHCKIGYEVGWKGKMLLCVGLYKGIVRFNHKDTTIFLDAKDEVHLPCIKAGIKCVEYHEGVDSSESSMQIYGKVYVPWESLK